MGFSNPFVFSPPTLNNLTTSISSAYTNSTPTTLTLTFILTPLLTYLVINLLTSFLRLRHIPGPTLWGITYIPFFLSMSRSRLLALLPKLHAQYGPLIRIGPNDLLLGDLDELLRTNGVRSSTGRSDWFRNMRFDWTGENMVTMTDTAEHDARKAILLRGYEGRGGNGLEKQVDRMLKELVALIRERYVGKTVDWAQMSRWYSMDVATLAVMGKPWGNMKSQSDLYGFFTVADQLIPYMHSIVTWAGLRKVTAAQWFLKLAGPKRTDKAGIGKFMGMAKAEVARRFANPDLKANDMLSDWMRQGLSEHDCGMEVPMATIAGSDTAAIPLRSAMLYIASNPRVYSKLKDEITKGIREGRISSPITGAEAQRLPYLQAVLHETFRIAPTTTTGFAKRVSPEGDTICGYTVPGGTDLYPNLPALLLDKTVWGEDPEIFRPERWLECAPEQRIWMDKHVDMLFGHGRWQCPGRTLAWLELNKVFVELLRNFDMQIVRPDRPWKLKVFSTLVISELYVRFTEGGITE